MILMLLADRGPPTRTFSDSGEEYGTIRPCLMAQAVPNAWQRGRAESTGPAQDRGNVGRAMSPSQPLRNTATRRRRRLPGIGFAAVLAVLPFPHDHADGYRFFTADWRDGFPGAPTARMWSSEHWGFGQTLSWVVSEDPGWTEGWQDWRGNEVDAPFTDARMALPAVGKALATWSGLESADVLWEVAGLEEGLVDARDGRMTVTVDPTTSAGAIAFSWRSRDASNNRWYVTECDVVLSPWAAASLGRDRLSSLIHEFGHCIGLDHAAVAPHSYHAVRHDTQFAAWGPSPNMSYGPGRANELHLDDIIGASLVRPAPGWLPTRGTISGTVTVAGEPATYLSVWALGVADSGTDVAVGTFSDPDGDFVIEGLPPGDYLIRAGPMIRTLAHYSLSFDATVDVNDGVMLDLVTVFPGILTDAVELDLLPSRGNSRPGPGRRGRGLALRAAAQSPCPGVTIEVASPAFTNNGQLVTTVTIERSSAAAETSLDLLGPYIEPYEGSTDPSVSATRVGVWRAQRIGELVRHEFEVEWADAPEDPDSDLRLGLHGGGCSGSPMIACSIGGCELIR